MSSKRFLFVGMFTFSYQTLSFLKLILYKKKRPFGLDLAHRIHTIFAWQRPTLAERQSDYHRR
ncbi:hypothetical protein, partial [Staphylococcus epidermidis]|uniref:hypothetical protein n=1 Tax=Staphylococcus epidermidis TaxID=1282 RepID=UPI0019D0B18E